MNWFRFSILDLAVGVAVFAILASENLNSTDIGSGVAVNAIGWPLKFHATTIADILETTTGERTRDVKITLFFDWWLLIINILVAALFAMAAIFISRQVHMLAMPPKQQDAG